MFHDYYLRGTDRDTTRAALLAAGLTVEYTESGEPVRMPAEGVNLSTIGTMYEGGEWDADGNMVTPPAAVPGWHVNLRLERPLTAGEATALGSIVVAPEPGTPYRVWASILVCIDRFPKIVVQTEGARPSGRGLPVSIVMFGVHNEIWRLLWTSMRAHWWCSTP